MSSNDPITMMRNSSQGRLQFRSLPLLVCFAAWPCAQAFLFCLSFLHTLYSVHNSPCAAGVWKWFFFSAVRLFFKIYFLYTCVSECMYAYRLHADTSGGQKRARHTHFQTGMDWGDMGIEESISMEANCLEHQKAVVSLREPRLHQGRRHFNIS